jgi:hypothetical protein
MATNFPGSVDNFSNPAATDSLNSPSHSSQHADANDAIEAIETYVLANPSGLVHIETRSISAVSAESFNNVFSATYNNYKVLIRCTTSGSVDLLLRLRASGTDLTANEYKQGRVFVGAGVSFAFGSNNNLSDTTIGLGQYDGNGGLSVIDFGNPFLTTRSNLNVFTSGRLLFLNSTDVQNTNSYDGFTVYGSSGTVTGVISVFGYRKS